MLACSFVIATVAAGSNVEISKIISHERGEANITQARQIAMYLAHIRMRIPQTTVGSVFNRDRTTVGYACKVVEERRDDENVCLLLRNFECAIQAWKNSLQNSPEEDENESLAS